MMKGMVMMRGTGSGIAAICAMLCISTGLWAAPSVSITTDEDAYSAGETIEIRLGGANYDAPVDVDVYIGLVSIDDVIYTLDGSGWGEGLSPWLAGLHVPNPFYQGLVPFQWFDIPCEMPPIADEGEYSFAAVLTQPDAFDFISDVSFATFAFEDNTQHIYVSAEEGSDWNDGSLKSPYRTVTHALASVVDASQARPVTIHIAAGTYSDSANGESFPLLMKSWVTISGENAETTIFDAERNTRVITCRRAEGVLIEKVTISRGEIAYGDGAGIYCSESSTAIIQNNVISDNSATHGEFIGGGGIYSDETTSLKIRNNLIVDNSATLGGGIYYYEQSPAIIEYCTIAGNTAKYGDGIYCDDPSSYYLERSYRPDSVEDDPINICDCILWDNGGSWYHRGYDADELYTDLYCCSAVYSCIEEEEGGEGNIYINPMFVAGDSDEYYLDLQSPCIDAGSRTSRDAGLSRWVTQVDCMPDVGTVDMGYHHPSMLSEDPPKAHIDSISPNPVVQGNEPLEFRGHGENGTNFIGYRWESDINGFLSNQQNFEIIHAAHLAIGDHKISFLVRDEFRGWSAMETSALAVLPNPTSEAHVSAEAGNDLGSGSEDDPFRTISHALGCVHGTQDKPVVIHVAAGLYSPSTNAEVFPLNMKSWVSVIGEGSDIALVSADQMDRVITCRDVHDLWIAGLKIRGGNVSGRTSNDARGGGILCDGSSPTIYGNTITQNEAEEGGGIACLNGSNAHIEANDISENLSGEDGAGIYCFSSGGAISNNTISNNAAVEICRGGGICCFNDSSPLISNNKISGNCAIYGGGIWCGESSPLIDGNLISGNGEAQYGVGGGIFCFGCSPYILNNIIYSNEVGYQGGGIHLDESAPNLFNNLITRNYAKNSGGGLFVRHDTSNIANNTISYNESNGAGGIRFYSNNSSQITDCIIWGNGDDLAGYCSATYCCIGEDYPGEGNIQFDPLFVIGPLGEYYLHPDSPCIDAGSRSAIDAGLSDRTTQTDGTPDSGTVDLGYHYPLP
ncbi:MAG: right-handed parallel beta-helix repeat-containing protein [Candidatus Coatesbacteria bacterium]|nr:right-handed parallel beta-helix repeat-containing protein [Candidatus Coatesbacteria bacterium]